MLPLGLTGTTRSPARHLGCGKHEPGQALRWASLNLDNRPTPAAYDLALSAAIRADDRQAGCVLGTRALQLRDRTARLEMLTARALDGCQSRSAQVPGRL